MDHDIVNVTGDAFLGGELELALGEGMAPTSGQTFIVFSADSLLNFFSNVTNNQRLNTVDGAGSFVVHYGPDSAFDPNQIVLTDFQSAFAANR